MFDSWKNNCPLSRAEFDARLPDEGTALDRKFIGSKKFRAIRTATRQSPTNGHFEVDETYLGDKEKNRHPNMTLFAGHGAIGKDAAIGIGSRVRMVAVKKMEKVNKKTLNEFIQANVPSGKTVFTDNHKGYCDLKKIYNHEVVVHSVGEYAHGMAHTDGIASFLTLLKRGYQATFHYFTWQHIDRYLSDFSFRWNLAGLNGGQRMDVVFTHEFSCRLTYEELIR